MTAATPNPGAGPASNPSSTTTGPAPSQAALLDALALHNRAATVEQRRGRCLVHVPVRQRWWNAPPLSWVLPYRGRKTYELDRLGREVWQLCDGRRVEGIIERFAHNHRLNFHEARGAVSAYIRTLVEKRLIVIAVGEDVQLVDRAMSLQLTEAAQDPRAVQPAAGSATRPADRNGGEA